MIASTTPGTHNPRISAQTVTNRLREIGERPPYTMCVLYAAFLIWPSIYSTELQVKMSNPFDTRSRFFALYLSKKWHSFTENL